MIYGEAYIGEYEICKRTIELIQGEILSREPYYLKPSFSTVRFDNSSVQH